MEMEEPSSDVSDVTKRTRNNFRYNLEHLYQNILLPNYLCCCRLGGGHSASQDSLQLLVPDETTPVPVYDANSLHYDMTGAKYLYIFNHEKFKKTRHFWFKRPPPRPGTEEDVRNLTETFQDQGFKVKTYQDKNYRKIIRIVTAIANQDHSRTSCLCIAILTHGKNNNDVAAADRSYRLTQIEYLLQNGNLVGKPKVLFVQACRDGHVNDGRRLKLRSGKIINVPPPADFFIMRSTFSDHYAFVSPDTGSFLIKAVCEALRENPELSYGNFITVVNQKVAKRVTTNKKNPKKHEKKQSPVTSYYPMKSLIFRQLPVVAARTNRSTTTATPAP